MPVLDVDDLVESGTAVLYCAATRQYGTGIRVAPGYLVTAAHVAGGVYGTVVEVDFGDAGRCTGTVIETSAAPGPDRRFFPFPDLCVLEIPPDQCPDAVCVLMAEPVFNRRDTPELRLMGLDSRLSELLRLSTETVEFDRYDKPFLKFSDRIVREGRSGGALYSGRLGVVIGVVKASADLAVAAGGLATPLLAGLRALNNPKLYVRIVTAHDAFHQEDGRWRDAPREDGDVAARRRHIDLVGLLARVPNPPAGGDLVEMYRRICPASPDQIPAARLLHPRDLAELIFAEFDDPITLALLHTELAALPGASAELAALADGATGPGMAAGRLLSLVGVISEQPSAQQEGQSYLAELFTVRAKPGDETGPASPERGYQSTVTGYPAAKSALQSLLNRYLANSEDVVELIEIAVPDEYLNAEDLYTWPRNPLDAADPRRLGDFGTLQLRRTATWSRYAEQRRTLREHWRSLSQAVDADHGLLWLDCRDASDAMGLHARLVARHGVGGIDPPTPGLLRHLAEFDPRPAMVWRRPACTDHDTVTLCAGRRFRAALSTDFTTRPASSWAETVDRVQRAASRGPLGPADEGAGWCQIIYVLERPGHHRSQVYLAPPRMRGGQ